MTKFNTKSNRGRKLKYGEPTKILTFRVPKTKTEQVKKVVKYIIENNVPDTL